MPGMRENRVKTKLEQGQVATVAVGLNDPDTIEFLGQFGFDGMWIETEHAPTTWDQVAHQSRACDLWGMTSICRVMNNDTALITRTLDAGCTGIAVPHVRTKAEAEHMAKSAKYAPMGYRGMGGGRQSFGVTDYHAEANEKTLTVAFIEDIEAIDNLPEILTVEHIDVFMVAPADLGASMGIIWRFGREPAPAPVAEAIDRGISTIVDAGKVAGHVITTETVGAMYDKGVRFMLSPWQPWLGRGASEYMAEVAKLGN